MIRAIYLIKDSLCLFDLKVHPVGVDPHLFSGFLDAIQTFGHSIFEQMDSINFQNLKLYYTPLNEDIFIATLADGDEPKVIIRQFLEKSKGLLQQYEDVLMNDGSKINLNKELAPPFTEILVSLPCPYMKTATRGSKCIIDNSTIKDSSSCNSYKVGKCEHVLEGEIKRYDSIFELNEDSGFTKKNVVDKVKKMNLDMELTVEAEAILRNLDKEYTVMQFVEGLRQNLASKITPREVLKILDEFERNGIVFHTQED